MFNYYYEDRTHSEQLKVITLSLYKDEEYLGCLVNQEAVEAYLLLLRSINRQKSLKTLSESISFVA